MIYRAKWARRLIPLVLMIVLPAIAGCATSSTTARVGQPAEVPAGTYNVRVLLAMGPTLTSEGEVTAAVIYTDPARDQAVEVWVEPRPAQLLERPLGRGNGREHVDQVKVPANYRSIPIVDRSGQTIGYAVFHERISPTVQNVREKTIVFLGVVRFLYRFDILRSGW